MSKADPEQLCNEADANVRPFAEDAACAEGSGQNRPHADDVTSVEVVLKVQLQETSGISRPASEPLSAVMVDSGDCETQDALAIPEADTMPTQTREAENPDLVELVNAEQGHAPVSPRTRSLEEEEEQEEHSALKAPTSPPPPEKVSVRSFGSGTIKICWDPVEHTPDVTHYAVLLKHDGVKEFVHGASGAMVPERRLAGPVGAHTTILTVNGLTAGTAYKARVAAKNEVGWGAYSDYSSYFTLKETPLAPNKPCIMALSASSIRVVWPTLEHSSPILNYKLQVHDGSMSRFFDPSSTKLVRSEAAAGTLPAHTTSVVVTGLIPRVPYRARVSAQSVEWGPYSDLSEAVEIAEPPRPQRPVLSLMGVSATRISWTAIWDMPEVTHYAILIEQDGATHFFRPHGGRLGKDISAAHGRLVNAQTESAAVPRSVTSVIVPGLVLGRTYKARVVARNILGWGAWSKYSKPVIVKPDLSASIFGLSSIMQDDGATEVQDSYVESVQAPEPPIVNGPDSP